MGTQRPGIHVWYGLRTQRGSLSCRWCDVDLSPNPYRLW